MTRKDILDIGNITHGRIHRQAVFADFLAMSAYTISNCFDPVHYQQRKEHLEAGGYAIGAGRGLVPPVRLEG